MSEPNAFKRKLRFEASTALLPPATAAAAAATSAIKPLPPSEDSYDGNMIERFVKRVKTEPVDKQDQRPPSPQKQQPPRQEQKKIPRVVIKAVSDVKPVVMHSEDLLLQEESGSDRGVFVPIFIRECSINSVEYPIIVPPVEIKIARDADGSLPRCSAPYDRLLDSVIGYTRMTPSSRLLEHCSMKRVVYGVLGMYLTSVAFVKPGNSSQASSGKAPRNGEDIESFLVFICTLLYFARMGRMLRAKNDPWEDRTVTACRFLVCYGGVLDIPVLEGAYQTAPEPDVDVDSKSTDPALVRAGWIEEAQKVVDSCKPGGSGVPLSVFCARLTYTLLCATRTFFAKSAPHLIKPPAELWPWIVRQWGNKHLHAGFDLFLQRRLMTYNPIERRVLVADDESDKVGGSVRQSSWSDELSKQRHVLSGGKRSVFMAGNIYHTVLKSINTGMATREAHITDEKKAPAQEKQQQAIPSAAAGIVADATTITTNMMIDADTSAAGVAKKPKSKRRGPPSTGVKRMTQTCSIPMFYSYPYFEQVLNFWTAMDHEAVLLHAAETSAFRHQPAKSAEEEETGGSSGSGGGDGDVVMDDSKKKTKKEKKQAPTAFETAQCSADRIGLFVQWVVAPLGASAFRAKKRNDRERKHDRSFSFPLVIRHMMYYASMILRMSTCRFDVSQFPTDASSVPQQSIRKRNRSGDPDMDKHLKRKPHKPVASTGARSFIYRPMIVDTIRFVDELNANLTTATVAAEEQKIPPLEDDPHLIVSKHNSRDPSLLYYRMWPKGDWSLAVKTFALGVCTSINGKPTDVVFDQSLRTKVAVKRYQELSDQYAKRMEHDLMINGYTEIIRAAKQSGQL